VKVPGAWLGGRVSPTTWFAALATLLAVGAVGWFAYQQGQLSAGRDAAADARERQVLAEKADRLEVENTRLNARVAELEMARRLDRDAYGQVERTLGDLQSQLARQTDDLAFYRSIVSPTDGIQGLRIQRFETVPGPGKREFVLKLTLVQAMRHENVVSGLVQIEINGMQGDKPTRYPLGQLVGKPGMRLPFSLRYFQTIEQPVTLPEGFEAFETEVTVTSSKLHFPMERSFPWKVGGAVSLGGLPDEGLESPPAKAE
jgi:hypothetical protein